MIINRSGIKRVIKIIALVIVLIIIIGYGIFASHDFLLGPEIIIVKPENGSTFYESKVEIVGIAKRIKSIEINGKPITIDEEGNWNEFNILSPGYNIFSIKAQDKFNREKEYRLELIYKVN